jgi:predicted DNA-binding mobile mystery protein A
MAQDFEIARRHLDERFTKMAPIHLFNPPSRGWVRAIRDALGMSLRQLAKRVGLSHSRVAAIEQGEVNGTLTLDTLRRAAEALNCELVYALVPKNTLLETIEYRSYDKAKGVTAQIRHSMELENQAVDDKEIHAQMLKVAAAFRTKDARKLWDEP